MRVIVRLSCLVLVAALAGCVSHPVTFQNAKYSTGARQVRSSVVVVIDEQTLAKKARIKSWMTGIANNWEAEPGDMLKQVADIELPQMFDAYEFSKTDRPPPGAGNGVVLTLTVPAYDFTDFHATISVTAVAKSRDGAPLLDKTYRAEGLRQGGKMFWGGAFGMKSAIRQSSLDAYKQIFTQLRGDLERSATG